MAASYPPKAPSSSAPPLRFNAAVAAPFVIIGIDRVGNIARRLVEPIVTAARLVEIAEDRVATSFVGGMDRAQIEPHCRDHPSAVHRVGVVIKIDLARVRCHSPDDKPLLHPRALMHPQERVWGAMSSICQIEKTRMRRRVVVRPIPG